MPYNKKQEVNEFDGTKYIRPAYISKHNNKRSTQVILLMITDGDNNWHYLANSVTRISGLLRGITSHKYGEFYCLNCFRPYSTKNMLAKHEKIFYNHRFCFPKMPDAKNNILKSRPGKKSLKHAFAICADLECLLPKINTCNNNPNKSYTIRKVLHKRSGYSLLT